MKFIIIGLGNFGASLAIKLTEMGHEVIGVDKRVEKIDAVKERLTFTVALDSTNPEAIKNLPVEQSDVVIVAIGEDEGSSILTTALMKQHNPKRLIGRAITVLHHSVLEAMGVDEIIHPEEEAAYRLAKRLELHQIIDSFEISEKYSIYEINLPGDLIGKTVAETEFRQRYNMNIITIIRKKKRKNILGVTREVKDAIGVVTPETILQEGDLLVVFARKEDLDTFLNG
ncbi:MAG: TrkA family potassium uptake protein [Saprospiraceae bacterium]|jgi:trk system potassium uptake protein TrkA|nr:TrkA family potassium uptake protein [Saprospiraceae bacterium]